MTYHEDPNMPRRSQIDPVAPGDPSNSTMMWIGGLLAIFLVVGGIIWATSSDTTRTASETPAVTTGASPTTPRTDATRPNPPANTTTPSPTTPAPNPPASTR